VAGRGGLDEVAVAAVGGEDVAAGSDRKPERVVQCAASGDRLAPVRGTVEATVSIVLKGPTKLCGDFGFAAADGAATAIAATATIAGTNSLLVPLLALDPDTTGFSAKRITTSIRFGFKPLRATTENGLRAQKPTIAPPHSPTRNPVRLRARFCERAGA